MAKNIFKSDWFSSTVGSMIGVLAAFLLNNLWNNHQLKKRQDATINNIRLEIEQNQEKLEESINKTETYLITLAQFLKVYDLEREKLIATPTDMYLLKTASEELVQITDSVPLGNNQFEYTGEIDLYFKFSLLNSRIKESAWKSALAIGDFQHFDFNLVQSLEETYSLQTRVKKRHTDLSDRYLSALANSESTEKAFENMISFSPDIHLLQEFQQLLSEAYKETHDVIGKNQ